LKHPKYAEIFKEKFEEPLKIAIPVIEEQEEEETKSSEQLEKTESTKSESLRSKNTLNITRKLIQLKRQQMIAGTLSKPSLKSKRI